ncbi:MAG TPA: dolichyl-phosphate beta-glucosyltransferase [Thermoanaerobaculia bacterium]|jgi:dolichyl-phosphate beta-glucosyltransferase
MKDTTPAPEAERRNPKSETASIVIPAFNEASRIEGCVRSVARWVRSQPGGWDWEFVLVDDGSTDDTAVRARRFAEEEKLALRLLSHRENRGKGAAIRTGVLASAGDPILISDTDLSTPLSEWVKLAERLPACPVSIGSRALEQDLVRKRQALYRVLLGKAGNLVIRLIAVPGIHDTQCGFKLFRGEVARELFGQARIDRFAWDVEVLYLARRRGYPIAEVPVLWFNSPESKVRIVRDTLQTLWDVLRIRWIHRRDPNLKRD